MSIMTFLDRFKRTSDVSIGISEPATLTDAEAAARSQLDVVRDEYTRQAAVVSARKLGFLAERATNGDVVVSQDEYRHSGEVDVITQDMPRPSSDSEPKEKATS